MTNYRDRIVAREWAEEVLLRELEHSLEEITVAEVILEVVKAPTLADMTDRELEGCVFMQALAFGERAVLLHASARDNTATLLNPNGKLSVYSLENVVPLFDLPRLEWPSTIDGGER